jgi:hypothetical protein
MCCLKKTQLITDTFKTIAFTDLSLFMLLNSELIISFISISIFYRGGFFRPVLSCAAILLANSQQYTKFFLKVVRLLEKQLS